MDVNIPPSPNRPAHVHSTWIRVAVNQLAFPGLGTVMAGRRIGYLQAAIMLIGFFLVMGYFGWFLVCIFRFLQTGNEADWRAAYREHAWTWQWGLLCCGVAWFWALGSSISMIRQMQSGAGQDKTSVPSTRSAD